MIELTAPNWVIILQTLLVERIKHIIYPGCLQLLSNIIIMLNHWFEYETEVLDRAIYTRQNKTPVWPIELYKYLEG